MKTTRRLTVTLIALGAFPGYSIGDLYRIEAAAPGTGYSEWRILAIDSVGLWGIRERSTVRELRPEEVR